MRPRINNTDLPPCLYERHGAFYYVKRGNWVHVGTDREKAIEAVTTGSMQVHLKESEIWTYSLKVLARARQNAKGRRGLTFTLTKNELRQMLEAAGWKCAVTRTPFSLQTVGTHGDKPFAPSIDRIGCSIGYERDNCRIVCVATNFAMNRWGEEVLRTLLRHMKNP